MDEINQTPSQEAKRAAMIARLDSQRDDFLKQHFAECAARGESPDLAGLMEGGMGLGAGDLYDEAELDALIAAEESNSVPLDRLK